MKHSKIFSNVVSTVFFVLILLIPSSTSANAHSNAIATGLEQETPPLPLPLPVYGNGRVGVIPSEEEQYFAAGHTQTITSADDLAVAIGIDPADILSASIGTSDPRGVAVGVQPLSYFPTQGGRFLILSTGLAENAYRPNSESSLSFELDGLKNSQGNDLVQFILRLKAPSDKNCVSFDFAFFSEEFPEYVGSMFNDTFTAEYGGSNLSIVQNTVTAPLNFAFDTKGKVISVNTVTGVFASTESTYDGGTSLLTASRPVPPGQTINLVFSVQDLGDSIYDSAVFLDNFRWSSNDSCGQGSTSKPPLLIVHGIQTINFQGGYSCSQGLTKYTGKQTSTMGDLPSWFLDEYDVWLAHLDTSPLHTPSIEYNAKCLQQQVNDLYAKNPGVPITIVAHSMGGLVSRACLANSECRSKVRSLYTLGTPHGGLNLGIAAKLLLKLAENYLKAHEIPLPVEDGVCMWQVALCQMSTESMLFFNANFPNQYGKLYTFIGGAATPLVAGTAAWLLEGSNDGIVGSRSAVGWTSATQWFVPPWWPEASHPKQYITDEIHFKNLPVHGTYYTYYDNREVGGFDGKSQSYACILEEMGKKQGTTLCGKPKTTIEEVVTTNVPSYTHTSEFFSGTIQNAQTVTHSVTVDTAGPSVFSVSWTNGLLSFYLVSPAEQVIDSSSNLTDTYKVLYSEQSLDSGGSAAYEITDTIPGIWQVVLTGLDIDPGAGYAGFVSFSSDLTLDASYYIDLQSDEVTITATLSHAGTGLSNATVVATLSHPDGSREQVPLIHTNSGVYQASYTLPSSKGLMLVDVSATGINDNGIPFYRETSVIVPVVQSDIQLNTGIEGNVRDANEDGLYESLVLWIPVSASVEGMYTFVADLRAGSELIASSMSSLSIIPGNQIVEILFHGSEIRSRKLDGPFTVTRLTVIDDNLGIQTLSTENVWQFPANSWQQFGDCFDLEVNISPLQGGDVVASPPPNCDNGTRYSADTIVQLTAHPKNGFVFSNWIAGAEGQSNTVSVMLDKDKTVVANFLPVTWGEPALIELNAEPSTAIANGNAQILLQILVRDSNGNVIPSQVVTFSSTLGNIMPVTATTNAAGIAFSSLASTQSGFAQIIAIAGSVSGETQVQFVAGPPAVVSLSADPVILLADGYSTSLITAHIRDANDNPVPNHAVTLTTSLGTLTTLATTDANGIATTTLTAGTVAGTAQVNATANSATASVEVQFVAGPPASIDISASPTVILANGFSTAAVTVVVKDTNGNSVPNHSVAFTTSLGTVTTPVTTDANGVATTTLTAGTVAGIAQVSATAGGAVGMAQVQFVAGPPTTINLNVDPATLPADGASVSKVTATVVDANGNPVSDQMIAFATTLGVIPISATTDANGVAIVNLTAATTSGTARVTATTGDVIGETQVQFVAGPPASIEVSASPAAILANGSSTSVVISIVKDAHGNPVAGQTVTFATTLGAITGSSVTNADGKAAAVLTSAQQVGQALVTASLGELSATTTVAFTGRVFSGSVFVDINQNGEKDAGEPGIANVEVEMTLLALAAETEQATAAAIGSTWRTQSDAQGNYTFAELPYGQYRLTLYLPTGYAATTPVSFTVTISEDQASAPAVGMLSRIYLPAVTR